MAVQRQRKWDARLGLSGLAAPWVGGWSKPFSPWRLVSLNGVWRWRLARELGSTGPVFGACPGYSGPPFPFGALVSAFSRYCPTDH